MGVFVFAIVIGQMREVLEAASASEDTFRRRMDDTVAYLRQQKLPEHVINKVRMWFDYIWKTQKMLDENEALNVLPLKMRMDLAYNVHKATLNKVEDIS